jgi:hypothetical protein
MLPKSEMNCRVGSDETRSRYRISSRTSKAGLWLVEFMVVLSELIL